MGFIAPIAGLFGAADSGLSTAFGLVGSAVSAVGSIAQGNAEAAAANYSAQVAQNNAKTANQNANYSIAAGETKAYDQALAERAQVGAITAGLASHGIDVNSGSAEDVRVSEAEKAQTDVETVRQQAQLNAYGYRTQATSFEAQSQLDKAQAGFDTEGGFIKAAGGLLTGVAKFGGGFGGAGGGASGGGGGNTLVFGSNGNIDPLTGAAVA